MVLSYPTIFIFYSDHNKGPQIGGLKQQNLMVHNVELDV